jgi:hypothetical protein
MFVGCGCGFGWPKKGSVDMENANLPYIIKSIEDHSPTVGKATLAQFFKSKQVHMDRSMSPSPESTVEGVHEYSLRAGEIPEKQAEEKNLGSNYND